MLDDALAVPAPGVSTVAPTTVIGRVRERVERAGEHVDRGLPALDAVVDRARHAAGPSAAVLAMTRTSTVASNDPVRPYPMRTASCSVVPFGVVASAAMLRTPLVMPPENPAGSADVSV